MLVSFWWGDSRTLLVLSDLSKEFCFTHLVLSEFSEEFCFTLLVLSDFNEEFYTFRAQWF